MSNNDELNQNLKRIRKAMQKPFRPDTSITDMQSRINANTAFEMQRAQQEIDIHFQEIAERNDERNSAIQRTALESILQTELLKEQLQKANERNNLLQKNYSELEEIYKKLKEESEANKQAVEESRREAKKARGLNIAAFVLSIVLPVLSIVASVLIAVFIK